MAKKRQTTTHANELTTHSADRFTIVLAEIRNRFVVRHQPTCQPHHFDVALRLSLKASAARNTIEVTVDIKLEKHRGMIRRPARRMRLDTFESKFPEIQFVDEYVDYSDRIVFTDIVVKSLWKQCLWVRSSPSMKRFMDLLHYW